MQTIEIHKDAVYSGVSVLTAYAGAKTESYDKTSILEADRELLDRFWSEGICDVAEVLAPVSEQAFADDNALRLSIRIDIPCPDQLHECVFNAIVLGIAAKWLALVGHEKADFFSDQSRDMLAKAKAMAMAEPIAVHKPFFRKIPPI